MSGAAVHTGSTDLTTPVVAATAAGNARGNMSGAAVHTGSTALTTPVVAATAAGTARGNMSGTAVHTGSTALTTPVVAATAAGTARRTVSGTVNTTTLDQSSFTNSVVVTGGAVIVSPSTGEALQAPAVTGARSPHTSEDSEDDEVEERGQQWRARLPRETGAETLPTTRSNTGTLIYCSAYNIIKESDPPTLQYIAFYTLLYFTLLYFLYFAFYLFASIIVMIHRSPHIWSVLLSTLSHFGIYFTHPTVDVAKDNSILGDV